MLPTKLKSLGNSFTNFFTTQHILNETKDRSLQTESRVDSHENQIIELGKDLKYTQDVGVIKQQLQYQKGKIETIEKILGDILKGRKDE